jgi:hypothetical protein
MDGETIEIYPLKIKYLREFMEAFHLIKESKNDLESISYLSECARIAMQQYKPEIAKTLEELEDHVDLPTIYKIINIGGGISVNGEVEEPVKEQALKQDTMGSGWDELDLAKLESEIFLLGIWKDYQELEISLSMPELLATLEVSRELDYSEKKFLAAIQGVDIEQDSKKGQQEWEDMKARVFSKGQTSDANDVLSLQGPKAKQLGFGIGMGLDYENLIN